MATKTAWESTLLRWGALAGIVGSIGGVAVNGIHPRLGSHELNDVPAYLDKVGDSRLWRPVHVAAISAVLLGLVAIGAILRSMALERPNPWVIVALVSTAVTAPLLLLSLSIDGFAMPSVAGRWGAASGAEQQTVLASAQALRDIDIAVLAVGMLAHFGVTALFLAAATWTTPLYGPRVALLAVAGGVMGIASGLLLALSGELTALSYLWLLSLSALLLTLWVLWGSILLLRRQAATVGARP